MSDDPASIEAWQQQMRDDIVTELRAWGTNGYMMKAADEIERLRKALLTEENAYDILRLENERIRAELVAISNRLNLERDEGVVDIERLRAERDEARRSVCEMSIQLGCVFRRINGKTVEVTTPEGCAEIMRWDCYKENP